ncbi:MAG: hypothetical protein ACI8QZ_002993 [Chlamydiales bacterium]|jgi:hypothetical protein
MVLKEPAYQRRELAVIFYEQYSIRHTFDDSALSTAE